MRGRFTQIRPLVSFALFLVLLCGRFGSADAAESVSHSWRLVAGAEFVVVGVLQVPPEIDPSREGPSYVDIPIAVESMLKGDALPVTAIRYPRIWAPYNVAHTDLIALNGRRALFFLLRGPGGVYFPNMSPAALQPADTSSIAEVSAEIARQKQVAENWQPHPNAPHRAEVRALIGGLLSRDTQDDAVRDLDALAPNALIAIVDAMDDRRQITRRAITVANRSPNAFEGLAHYRPELVVDVCVGILDRGAGAFFFPWLLNGGDERTRQLAVAAWRVYADMPLNHPDDLGRGAK